MSKFFLVHLTECQPGYWSFPSKPQPSNFYAPPPHPIQLLSPSNEKLNNYLQAVSSSEFFMRTWNNYENLTIKECFTAVNSSNYHMAWEIFTNKKTCQFWLQVKLLTCKHPFPEMSQKRPVRVTTQWFSLHIETAKGVP